MPDDWAGATPWEFDDDTTPDLTEANFPNTRRSRRDASVTMPIGVNRTSTKLHSRRRLKRREPTLRAITIRSVSLTLIITVLITIVTWPRPPRLTDEEFVALLTADTVFTDPSIQTFKDGNGRTYLAEELESLSPEELAGVLNDSAQKYRDYFPFDSSLNDCATNDLRALIESLRASANFTLESPPNTIMGNGGVLFLFDKPEQASATAKLWLSCEADYFAQSTQDATSYPPIAPTSLTEGDITIHQTPTALTMRWSSSSGPSDTLTETFQLATIAYGNITIITYNDTAWTVADPVISAMKDAIDRFA